MQVFDLFVIRFWHEAESTGNHDQTYEIHERDTDGSGDTKLHEDLARGHDESCKTGSRGQVAQE